MVLKFAASASVAGHTTLELSHEALRSLIGQIEAELYHSEIYQRAAASLQTLQGQTVQGTLNPIEAVAKEAIWLALKQFIRLPSTVQVANFGNLSAPRQGAAVSVVPEAVRENVADAAIASSWGLNDPAKHSLQNSTAQFTQPIVQQAALQTAAAVGQPRSDRQHFHTQPASWISTNKPTAENYSHTQKPKIIEPAPQTTEQQRLERVRQIGKELKAARVAQLLSLQELQRQTLVSLPHLEALETGNLDRLPEDVYVRGFIRRFGDALGLDGASLAASIPAPDHVKSVVPSWSAIPVQSGVHLGTGHLYLGYAALVVGAVGGLSWISGQATPRAVAETDPATSSPAAVSQSDRYAKPISTPGLKSSSSGHTGGPVWTDVAPPESLAY